MTAQMAIWEEALTVRACRHDSAVPVAVGKSAPKFKPETYRVGPLDKGTANEMVVRHHYLHRKPNVSHCFGLFGENGDVLGAVTFGTPASRHLQQGMCPSDPGKVIELNRLWVHDSCPTNTESFFVARALHALPPLLVVSYADTAWGHDGTIYRALNFNYAGWTDMDRKTARYDYIPPDGLHTRDSFRDGEPKWTHRVRRKPKAKYWIATGNRRERKLLERACAWPSIDWNIYPVPTQHTHLVLRESV